MSTSHTHATALLADLQTTTGFLPRREDLVIWLENFLRRAGAKNFHAARQELDDLDAIDQHLRVNQLRATPAAARAD